jgi:predicted amidohydrolase
MTHRSRQPLRVAVAQFDAVSGDIDHNTAYHLRLLEHAAAAGAALVLFPELSLTGYCSSLLDQDADARAVDPTGDAVAELKTTCARLGIAAIVGAPTKGDVGAPTRSDNALHLSAIAIRRDGDIDTVYHKMYLDEDERRWFTRGTTPRHITLDGWKLGLGICYDSSFPEHARHYALDGADAYLLAGAFPKGSSDYRRQIYFPARALENTVYLAFANYVGTHDGLAYGGMSAIHAPDGQCLAHAGAIAPGIAIFSLDDQVLADTREKLPMLEDRG